MPITYWRIGGWNAAMCTIHSSYLKTLRRRPHGLDRPRLRVHANPPPDEGCHWLGGVGGIWGRRQFHVPSPTLTRGHCPSLTCVCVSLQWCCSQSRMSIVNHDGGRDELMESGLESLDPHQSTGLYSVAIAIKGSSLTKAANLYESANHVVAF